jgi:UDP-N-acetylglucosamine diphosphorylase / glucose-1-phosphate thymidylyltransferase / UDP-N-acetylgalactosamine diphosphorylase / glucosamine-1-phosphate N-acetyltransferase / galactosamine-1-phosphate N-acetyltransferase
MKTDALDISSLIRNFKDHFPGYHTTPWDVVRDLPRLVKSIISSLGNDYVVRNDIAVHKKAEIEERVTLKGPLIIGDQCFIASNCYLRGGVFLSTHVALGPGCEVKSSVVLENTALAHFNFVGDSILGANVNMEAGSVIANHHNDRQDKTISLWWNNTFIKLDTNKFGAIVGDEAKIGANAVLAPGTILEPATVVHRLSYVQQDR